ncbi:amino acid adenylation domain-containing protein [Desulfosporosinus sp. SB140]|uniref:non-ribosomal peptide synthetase family protein n=1 Tax=Desulfosporosinus paludis TaxID=3115649 RepID=UPI003890DBFC
MNEKYFHLSYPQQSIWTLEQYYQSNFSNIATMITIFEEVNYDKLKEAINLCLEQNDALRIKITQQDNNPLQYISEYKVHDFELKDFTYPDGLNDLATWEKETTQTPFTIKDSELFYFALLKTNNQEGALYLKCHHIISDVWGTIQLINQILNNYRNLINNQSVSFELKPSYINYLLSEDEYYCSEKFEKNKNFWNNQFDLLPEKSTYIKKRSSLKSTNAKRKTFILSNTEEINVYCLENKISIFIFLFAIFSIYISRIISNEDIVISTPVLNRSNSREKTTIGMFTDNVLFKTHIDRSLDFYSYTQKLTKDWRNILKNQRYPYNLLLRDLRNKYRNLDRITDITLSYQNAKFDVLDTKFKANWCFNGNEINSLAIHINDREGEGQLILDYVYLSELFTIEEIEQIHNGAYSLIQNILNNPQKELSGLEVLSEEEKERILLKFNSTKINYSNDKSLNRLFENQVEQNPDKIALIFEEQELTYGELNRRANALAHYLRSRGVTRDTIVALLAKRSFEMLIGMIGVLKAGGAYLPLDSGYPEARINYILKDSNAKILLTHSNLESTLNFPIERIYLDEINLYDGVSQNPDENAEPNNLAYAIYTSGSTGNPKGVMIEHKSVNNFIHAIYNELNFSPNDTIICLTTFSFDIFVLETLLPLAKGLKVVIANEDEQRIPRKLFNLINCHKVNIIQVTPTRMLSILKDTNGIHSFKNLSKILIGGERFPEPLLDRIKHLTSAEVYNLYGPTETTVWSTVQKLKDANKISIGKPIANTQIYILDSNLKLLPVGVAGEIYIGGDGLARGYLNNHEMTRKKFIVNPYSADAKIYKTGDLGRWLPDGSIEYIGRNDAQVKIRGFRIELGEIENCLLKFAQVEQAAVTMKEDRSGKGYLNAYLVGNKVSDGELRSFIEKYLPDYMIPTHFIWVNEIPLTPNGKIDRKALPELDQIELLVSLEYTAPRNTVEIVLAEVWAKALEVKMVGIDDNLFSLGGDSLTVLEILSDVFSYDWGIIAQDFYDFPTIRELSTKIKGHIKEEFRDESIDVLVNNFVNTNQIVLPSEGYELGNILLTGATGFLGIHILKELITNISGKIYCLIRGNKPFDRLVQSIEFYFPGESTRLVSEKLIIINGDLTKEKFGLAEDDFNMLTQVINTVIHSAANVKHYGDYSEFEKVNLNGTKEIVEFCLAHHKNLNHISTMSVSGNYLVNQEKHTEFTEDDLYIGQNYKDNVYVRSKFEAETIIVKARNSGLRAKIFRVGILTGRYLDGKFQKNAFENAFYNRLKSIIRLGIIPEDLLEQPIEFTPVDFCAKGIVEIIRSCEVTGFVYHIYNYKIITLRNLLKKLELLGYSFKILNRDIFEQHLKNIARRGNFGILNGLIVDLSLNKGLTYSSTIKMGCEKTTKDLMKLGFYWPDIDTDYLKRIFTYMNKIGFLES